MKNKIHLLIVVVVAVVIICAVVGLYVIKAEPDKILENAFSSQAKLSKYRIDYNLSYVKSSGFSINANGDMRVMKNGNITKVSINLETFGEKISLEQYQTPDGIIQCSKYLFNTTCEKTNASMPIQTPEEQAKALKEMLDKKTITLKNLGSKTIIGRNCDAVESVYDVKNQDLPFAGADLKEARVEMCLDKTSGVPLEFLMVMNLDSETETGELKIGMTATNIEFDVGNIVLPVADL